MIIKTVIALPLLLVSLTCGAAENSVMPDDTKPYVIMQEDLAQLRADFNKAVDQIRLVFIVGPT
jgi:hypothetical protein